MEWDVQLDDDFAAWLAGLEDDLRNDNTSPSPTSGFGGT